MPSTANSASPNPSQVESVWLSTPTISLPASPILFGPQLVGTTSSPATITVTNVGNAPLALSAVAASTDNAGASPQSVALAGTGSSIAISAAFGTATVSSPGVTLTDTIQVSSVQGFTGAVTLNCTVTYKGSGTPTDAPVCNINPQQAQLSASSPLTVALTVSTTKTAKSRTRWLHTGGAFAAVFLIGLVPVRRRKYAVPLVVCGIALGLAVAGCGGGGPGAHGTTPSDPGTTAGTYQVLITAASSTVSASTTISFTLE